MGLFSFFQSKADPPSAASIQFGLSLVQQATQDATGNVIVSPVGVLAAMALALNGAGGATRQELGNALFDSAEGIAEAEAIFGNWLR